MPKMINLASTDISRSARLSNKTKQKYDLFVKLSIAVIGECEVAKNSHIILTRSNQHIQEINRHFNGTLNHFGPVVFAANQEQNESYTFKEICCNQISHILLYTLLKRFNHMSTEII